jgi:hypothetical protein
MLLLRFMTISAAGDPRVQPGEECRLSFPLSDDSKRIGRCRLRHSGSPERDGSPTGSFPTERSRFQARTPCLGKTFSVDDNALGSACWVRTGTLSMCPDASGCEAKAERRLRYSELRWSPDVSRKASLRSLSGGD